MAGNDPTGGLRGILLAIFVLGSIGTAGELLLVGHFEDPWQWLPLALLAAALLALGAFGVTGSRVALVVFRGVLVLLPPSALLGLILHYRANVEFARESQPDLAAGALLWEAVQGTAPPTLAPGAMILLGLAGLGYTWRHPRLKPRLGSPAEAEGGAGLPAEPSGGLGRRPRDDDDNDNYTLNDNDTDTDTDTREMRR